MSHPAHRFAQASGRRRSLILTSTLAASALCLLPAGAAFAAAPASPASSTAPLAVAATAPSFAASTPAETLASTPWETTSAVDQDGNPVALDHPGVANFVGWAYYSPSGTFTMYNLDDTPKMQGDWSVTPDGTSRTITAKNDAGETLFTRVVPITVLTGDEFTYRVIPDATEPGTYFDIVHTPTDHPEPVTPPVDPGTEEPGTEEPGTEEPGTEEPGTEKPGVAGPDTQEPGTNTPGTNTAPEPATPGDPLPATTGAKSPEALAVTGGNAPLVAGVGGALAVLAGAGAFVLRALRRAGA